MTRLFITYNMSNHKKQLNLIHLKETLKNNFKHFVHHVLIDYAIHTYSLNIHQTNVYIHKKISTKTENNYQRKIRQTVIL